MDMNTILKYVLVADYLERMIRVRIKTLVRHAASSHDMLSQLHIKLKTQRERKIKKNK